MALDALVGGTVVAAVVLLVTYRLLRRKERQVAPPRVDVRTIMMVAVSLLVLGSSLFIILSGQYDNESQKWAFGVVGMIVGFWLRPEK
jgi:xanthine/uracil permease